VKDVIKEALIYELLPRTVLVDGLPEALNENALRKEVTRLLKDEVRVMIIHGCN
jgi:hypothetical protein